MNKLSNQQMKNVLGGTGGAGNIRCACQWESGAYAAHTYNEACKANNTLNTDWCKATHPCDTAWGEAVQTGTCVAS